MEIYFGTDVVSNRLRGEDLVPLLAQRARRRLFEVLRDAFEAKHVLRLARERVRGVHQLAAQRAKQLLVLHLPRKKHRHDELQL